MEKFVLIMAGGSGLRMGADIPKQFIEVNGKPIILHTINRFIDFDPDIHLLVVLPEGQLIGWNETCLKFGFNYPHLVIIGGSERFFSVKNGLDKIDGEGVVFIHDAVRPMVSAETITNCYKVTIEKGNAVPAWPVSESLRMKDGIKNFAVDRSSFLIVQTPQTFIVSQIKKAYNQEFRKEFTDDATVLESMGESINLVSGNRDNIKITYSEDLKIASMFLF